MNRGRETLITANLGIVPHVARPFRSGTIPFEDLIQDGYIGLLEAVDRFDPNRGAKFSTYACWWIRKALNDAFSFRSRLIRLPDWVRRDLFRLRETTYRLKIEMDRPPTDDEIAGRTGLSVRRIKRLRLVASEPGALEDIATDRGEGWQSVVAVSGTVDPFEETLMGELSEQTSIALEQLNPRERHIIRLRFGFDEDDGKTLKEIAEKIGVSRERVRQIESVALGKVARWARRFRIQTG